ncbi:MAG: DMT family transporter [Kiritimatiellae bacterium]|nr:DMT family transporter [Kiritimatiellia bacterium]
MWTAWILSSAVFLALYDVAKKASVRGNAVLPVLLVSASAGTAAYVAALASSGGMGDALAASPRELALVLAKSLIVGLSWTFTYCALRTLPVTIATPIRASAPALVFVAAFFIYGERPTIVQGAGMLLVFAGYWAFGWAGRHEGIDFLRSRAVWFAVGGMFMSALSSLWDKFILQRCAIPVETVQLWFQAGLVAMYAAMLAGQRLMRIRHDAFEWRWTIPLTGVLLVAADWLYFHGLAVPGVSIAAGSLLRRFSVVITFALGAVFFHERNLRRKGVALAAVLAGVAMLCL